jgi:uncharacterized repeat protein (TIGR03943 family)
MSNILSRWLPGATLLAWATLLLYFFLSGRLSAFLVPMFRPLVLVAGLLLLVLAVMAWTLPGGGECCEDTTCSHPLGRVTSGRILVFLVLFLPVYAALSLPRDGFGVNAIENRGLILDGTALGLENSPGDKAIYEPPLPAADGEPADSPSEESIDPSEYIPRTPEGFVKAEVIDFLYAASEPTLRSDFENEIVEVIGQVMPDNDSTARGTRFILVRMFMTCCAADARPVGVVVELDFPTTLGEMSWVRVIGKVEFPLVNGKPAAIVSAREVIKTDPPAESMLY